MIDAVFIAGKKAVEVKKIKEPSLSLDENMVLIGMRSIGICGSDMHYYEDGRVGDFVIQSPLIPGHEGAGKVLSIGKKVSLVSEGDMVAINPQKICGICSYCISGNNNFCENLFFHGSASKIPHMMGLMAEKVMVEENRCFQFNKKISYEIASLSEPLSVALHAVNKANVSGNDTVLITGAGVIGLLVVFVLKQLKNVNVIVTDVREHCLRFAKQIGADQVINVKNEPFPHSIQVDKAIEASGSTFALSQAIDSVRPFGMIVQLGSLNHDFSKVPFGKIMTKEIHYQGSFRFQNEFPTAVNILKDKGEMLEFMLTKKFHFTEAKKAFEFIADSSSKNLKVSIIIDK